MVHATLRIMGSQSLLNLGALSVRLSEGSLVLMTVCSVKSNCVLHLLVMSIVVLSRELWAEADCMWEKSVGLWSKSPLEWASCFLILLVSLSIVGGSVVNSHYQKFRR